MTADVCQWDLSFRFRSEDRCNRFIKKLLKLPNTLTFTYSSYFDGTHDQYRIEIEGPWAHNLTKVAKLLEKVDYEPE